MVDLLSYAATGFIYGIGYLPVLFHLAKALASHHIDGCIACNIKHPCIKPAALSVIHFYPAENVYKYFLQYIRCKFLIGYYATYNSK